MRARVIFSAILAILLVGALAAPQQSAQADIAPPKMPPGTTLLPGQEQTQVRMMAETVTLAVSTDPAHPDGSIARTDAVFTMRNLGSIQENLAVRFPLSFFDGSSDGRDAFPEIPAITASVDGKRVPTKRDMQPPFESPQYGNPRPEIPWSVFEVSFPPGEDVTIEVTYTVNGYGYYPQAIFDYILETGAAWNGPIGSADIIVSLPYAVSESNVLLSESNRWSASTPGGVVSGNQVRWHYSDLEPTPADNFEVLLVAPSLWESILKDEQAVKQNPKDGETWGLLAKGYKQAALLPKGWTRDDSGGQQLLNLSQKAYESCLALLPKDPLWHYGYAELLWLHYYYDYYSNRRADTDGLLPRALAELRTTLTLDPGNTQAKDLLLSISGSVPGAVEQAAGSYDFLGLTATPAIPTPYPDIYTATPEAAPTSTAIPPPSPSAPASPAPASSPAAPKGNPVCGGAFLLLGLPAVALLLKRGRGPAGRGN